MKNKFSITFLGTGHATATECFNSCFAIKKDNNVFLVDSGGGNGILKQLKDANIDLENIRTIFISHNHLDHILGVIWIIRILARKIFKNQISLPIYIYGNDIVIDTIEKLVEIFIPNDFKSVINDKIILEIINNNDEKIVLNNKIKFFDLYAKKTSQHGFIFEYEKNKKFCFIGDEVFSSNCKDYIKDCEYLYADAYMCGEEAEKYNPIEKHHHSTVKYISKIAEQMNVKNLILSHTIDNNLSNRKKEFTKDAKLYYNGNIIVPDDLETIDLQY